MKTSVSIVLLALLAAGPASAQGMNLFWDDCALGVGHSDKSFACDADAGPSLDLIVSIQPQNPIDNVIGARGILVLEADAAALPDFWRLDALGCRAGALTAVPNAGGAVPPISCAEAWSQAGGATGGVTFYYQPSVCWPNRAAIHWYADVPSPVVLDPGIGTGDFYLTRLSIARTGTTSCSGCAIATCIVATEVRLLRPAGSSPGDIVITQPALAQQVTTQGGGTIACPNHGLPSCPVPVGRSTWGQIKSMYR